MRAASPTIWSARARSQTVDHAIRLLFVPEASASMAAAAAVSSAVALSSGEAALVIFANVAFPSAAPSFAFAFSSPSSPAEADNVLGGGEGGSWPTQ